MKRLAVALLVTSALLAMITGCGCNGSKPSGVRSRSGLPVAYAVSAGKLAQDRSAAGAATGGGGGQPSAPSAGDQGQTGISETAVTQTLEGLTVTGYGMASAQPDSAILEFYFSSGTSAKPVPDTNTGAPEQTAQTATIAEADLQPVIDAIVARGIARDDIEFLAGSYYDVYYSSATLRVTVRDISALGDVVQAATDASSRLANIYLQGSLVNYAVADCAAVEKEALKAAVDDARTRGDALAESLSVSRGSMVGAMNSAYSPFGGTACGTDSIGPYPIGGVAYAREQVQQVVTYATVTVTYQLQ